MRAVGAQVTTRAPDGPAAARATGMAIVLELDGLEFLDSSGLNLILATWEAARRDDTPFTLTPGRPNVHRVFHVAGLDDVLPFERRS